MLKPRRRWFRFASMPLEDSITLRAWTLAVVLIGVLAILHEEEWPTFGWLAVGLTVLGYWLSYVRRGLPNWGLKILIVCGMVWAMQSFFSDLFTSANDPRIPLANLLMWLQTLHAFDLPYRHNLNVSFFVGIVLMAVAAVMSTTLAFVAFFLAFAVASMFMLQYSYLSWRAEGLARSELPASSQVVPRPVIPVVRTATAWRVVSTYLGMVVAATVIAYLLMPHFSGLRIRTLPIAMTHGLPHLGSGGLVNPAYPGGLDPSTAAKGGKVFDPDSYNGFNNYLDLNVRGQLSDNIVMRVRSSRWTYYRALAFDRYDGKSWQMSDEKLKKTTSASPPVIIQPEYPGNEDLVQIFYLEKDMSNVIMGTYHINQVFFPGDTLYVDRYGGVRADFALSEGTTYSVISRVSNENPTELIRRSRAALRFHRVIEDPAPYLVLPATVPSRVSDLARQLTQNVTGNYQKAYLLADWLKRTYRYSLATPPYPDNADVTDYFLFEARAGSCEQFATSLAVLCRAAGVPARLVVGYLPGNFNPFSGVYEVKASDAHSWVEILVPLFGWVSLDATPGGETQPGVEVPSRNRWMIQTIANYIANNIHLPAALRDVDFAHPLLYLGVTVSALGVCFALYRFRLRVPVGRWLSRWTDRRRAAKPAMAGPPAPSTELKGVRTIYQRMLAMLARAGYRKTAAQTPAEFAAQTGLVEVLHLTALFEQLRYGPRAATGEDVATMEAELKQLVAALQALKRSRRPARKSLAEPPVRSTS